MKWFPNHRILLIFLVLLFVILPLWSQPGGPPGGDGGGGAVGGAAGVPLDGGAVALIIGGIAMYFGKKKLRKNE